MRPRHALPASVIASPQRRANWAGHLRRTNRARFHLERLDERCLLSGLGGIIEYPLPADSIPGFAQIALGPDGNLWFNEYGANAIGEINPTTHAVSSYTIPGGSHPFGIAAGPDGNVWFTERTVSNVVGEINPTTHAISTFTIPTIVNNGSSVGDPMQIAAGPDGNMWVAMQGGGDGAIAEINPTTHAISVYPTPASMFHIWSIAKGPDGNMWFGGSNGTDSIGEINPTTHAISVFAAPDQGTGGTTIQGITAGPDGNVWFTDENDDAVGMINPTTDAVTEYSVPTASASPMGITAGPDGNLWFTEAATGKLASINPATGAITEYPVPYAGADGQGIAIGPDGNLWFRDSGTNAIGVATLTSNQLVVTQQPPSSVTAGAAFGLTVQAEDASGDPLTSFNGAVTVALASNPGGATLGGTLTATATNGVATFSGLTLTKAASGYTLVVSGSALGAGTTNAITVTPAAASQVVITQQPPSTVSLNSAFGFQAAIEDAYGNVVTSAANTLTVALANNPGGAKLGGTTSVAASGGYATFSGLTLNKTGSGYTLRVTGAGLTGATTGAITVKKGSGGAAAVAASPSQRSPTEPASPSPILIPLALDDPTLLDAVVGSKRPSLF